MRGRELGELLTLFQNRLLWMLQEARAEDFCCIFNTLRPGSASELESELQPLLRRGWVSFYKDLGRRDQHYVELSDEEIKRLRPLSEWMLYDDARGHWRRMRRARSEVVEGLMLNEVAMPFLDKYWREHGVPR
jgi:hypothetical protein